MHSTGVTAKATPLVGKATAAKCAGDKVTRAKAAVPIAAGLTKSSFTPSTGPLSAASRTSHARRADRQRVLAQEAGINVQATSDPTDLEEIEALRQENERLKAQAADKLKELAEKEKKRIKAELAAKKDAEEAARIAELEDEERERKEMYAKIEADKAAAQAIKQSTADAMKAAALEEAQREARAAMDLQAAQTGAAQAGEVAAAQNSAAAEAAEKVGAAAPAAQAKEAESKARADALAAAKAATSAAEEATRSEAEEIRKIAQEAAAAARAAAAASQGGAAPATAAASQAAAAKAQAFKAAEEQAQAQAAAQAQAQAAAAAAQQAAAEEAVRMQALQAEQQAQAQAAMQAAAAEAAAAAAAQQAALEREKLVNSAEYKAREAARAEADAGADQGVVDQKWEMYFTCPAEPVAGEPCVLYFNRAKSGPLNGRPRIVAHVGFNHWEIGNKQMDMTPTSFRRDGEADWWSLNLRLPKDAMEMNFVFSDGDTCYDNNGESNYNIGARYGPTEQEWAAGKQERERNAAAIAAAEEEERIEAEAAAARDANLARIRSMAETKVNECRGEAMNLAGSAQSALEKDGRFVFCSEPQVLLPGQPAVIRFNKAHTPVHGAENLVLHWGYNSFCLDSSKVPMKKANIKPSAPGQPQDNNNLWYEATVQVPASAVVMDFVVSDDNLVQWDNNDQKDYHLKVAAGGDPWAAAAEDCFNLLVLKEEEERRAEEERVAKRIARKAMAKAQSREVLRKQMRHVLYTEPGEVMAGQDVSVFYYPENTNLNGAQSIYVRGGFNRWNEDIPSFGPIKMSPTPNGYYEAKVSVHPDAFMMDYVFSDVMEGDGQYDNNHGTDYHSLVTGPAKAPPLNVVHISVEMAPICKVGGLGDVVTALSRAISEEGHNVEIVLPAYEFLRASPLLGAREYETSYEWGGCGHVVTKCRVEDIMVFFIEPTNGFFNKNSVYGFNDDAKRFDHFCGAALDFLVQTGRQPDIIHCHDWSTAPVAGMYWNNFHHNGLWKPKIVFTIHNLEFGQAAIGDAAYNCQKMTTVSPTYRNEISEHPAVASAGPKFSGVRNGIDPEIWNPETDQFLPLPYSPDNVVAGKMAAKRALRERFGLSQDRDAPLVGVVSRLTNQKGTHLIKHAAHRTVDRGGQFVLLGSAPDPKIQGDFNNLASSMDGSNSGFCFSYDEPLSHLMYAGCDFILVPSMFEPCGLTQMIAMNYGAVPIVRSTGGLHDTVFDVDNDQGRAAWEVFGSTDYLADQLDGTNGFSFWGTDEGGLDSALDRAIDRYWGHDGNDRSFMNAMYKRNMEQDWSWNRPALDYIELYFAAVRS